MNIIKFRTRIPPECDQINRKESFNHFLGHCGLAPIPYMQVSRTGWDRMFSLQGGFINHYLIQTPVWENIKADTFFVVPSEWPEEVRPAFRLADPPTPYEVSTRIYREMCVNNGMCVCDGTALWWWLAGLPSDTLETLGFDLKVQLPRAVSALCTSKSFYMWAMGTDLSPATGGNPVLMRESQKIMYGINDKIGNHHDLTYALYNSAWVQGQIFSGERLLPIKRHQMYPNYFFETVGSKKARFPFPLV